MAESGGPRVLVLVPRLDGPGGIANYYRTLRAFFPDRVRYAYRGSGKTRERPIAQIIRLIADLGIFVARVLRFRPDLVHFNTSLAPNGLMRDSLFMFTARFLGIPSMVFFRGWSKKGEAWVDRHPVWFRRSFGSASRALVLASDFRDFLQERLPGWPVELETTVVDSAILPRQGTEHDDSCHFLFLSRLEEDKGVGILLQALAMLGESDPGMDWHANIAGSGSYEDEARRHLAALSLEDRVTLLGRVDGAAKQAAFASSSVFVFPSFHGEGMPNSVLEAMACGLPVVTTRVGGVADFFEPEQMGWVVEQRDAESLHAALQEACREASRRRATGSFNRDYAMRTFLDRHVADRLLAHYASITENV